MKFIQTSIDLLCLKLAVDLLKDYAVKSMSEFEHILIEYGEIHDTLIKLMILAASPPFLKSNPLRAGIKTKGYPVR